jgi:hypothetical protein
MFMRLIQPMPRTLLPDGRTAASREYLRTASHFLARGAVATMIFDFMGGSVTKSVKMNSHFNFHYDETLRRVGPGRGCVATNSKEN